MKSNYMVAFIYLYVIFYCDSSLACTFTFGKSQHEGGIQYNRVTCENGNWDYIWFDGEIFYIEDSMGSRHSFESSEAAAEYVCGKEDD